MKSLLVAILVLFSAHLSAAPLGRIGDRELFNEFTIQQGTLVTLLKTVSGSEGDDSSIDATLIPGSIIYLKFGDHRIQNFTLTKGSKFSLRNAMIRYNGDGTMQLTADLRSENKALRKYDLKLIITVNLEDDELPTMKDLRRSAGYALEFTNVRKGEEVIF